MTIKEVIDTVEAYNKREKASYIKMYNAADLISAFTISRLNGKQVPKFMDVFPELRDEKDEEQEKKANNEYIRATMEAFVIQHNANRRRKEKMNG